MAYQSRPPAAQKRRAAAILRVLKKLFPDTGTALSFRTPWELMVAVQLSAQCTDKKVNEVTMKLFKKYRKLDDYVNAKPREFERDIYQTGFYKNKTKNILAAAKKVKNNFGGKLPKTMEALLTIPGVARKTANVVLANAYGVSEGIAVDTHVKRLSNQLGLTKQKDPNKIERDLMALYSQKEWRGLSNRLIYYGRQYSPAQKKDHSGEPLGKYYVSRVP
jgi:endonuclease-3